MYTLGRKDMMASLHKDISMNKYLSLKKYISGSELTDIWFRADKYHIKKQGHQEEGQEKLPKNEAFLIGDITHSLVLEPEKFNDQYHIIPRYYIDKKTGKEKPWIERKNSWWVHEDKEKAEGKVRIKENQLEEASHYSNAIEHNDLAMSYLQGESMPECTMLVETDQGIKFKSRPDDLKPKRDIAINLKTAFSVKPNQFYASAFDHGYDLSAALTAYCYQYVFGRPLKDYIIIAVEKSIPYCPVEVFRCADPISEDNDATYLQFGAKRLKQALRKYKWCLDNNCWPAYDNMHTQTIKSMEVPNWAMSMVNDYE